MSEQRKERAYVVHEAFHGAKQQLVFARTGREAADKCRRGEIEVCLSEDGPHPAGIRQVRREPGEDRNV